MADIVRTIYYIIDVCRRRHRVRGLRRKARRIRPAATLLVVAGLYKPAMKVEVEVTAKRRTA